jgi:cell division protein ZapA
MAEVNLAIHGRNYGIACDDGQEQRVIEVGRYVDTRAREIAQAGAAGNETHLMVLTALVLADEISELHMSMKSMKSASRKFADSAPQRISDADEKKIADAITSLSARIDSVAKRLQQI